MTNVNNKNNEEKTSNKIYEEKLVESDVKKWIKNHRKQFGEEGKEFYDLGTLEKMKRFANAPIDYIDERIELNKSVSKDLHKLHTTILLAVFSGFYVYLLAYFITSLGKISDIYTITFREPSVIILFFLLVCGIIAVILQYKRHLTVHFLKWLGMERVIRDSEIEIYYLSLIKENRNKIRCLKCNLEIPKDSKFCNNCGSEIK